MYNLYHVPGSHDSFSSILDKNGPVASDVDDTIKSLAKLFPGMIKDIICKWSNTQSQTISDQLKSGIRYFDLRLTTKPNCGMDIYMCHCLYSDSLEAELSNIKMFLEEHPKEVVLIDMNHFYNMTNEAHRQCLSMILEVLGDKMCPFLDMESVTLSMLWEAGLQVLVFYQHPVVVENLQFWPGSSILSPWANTADVRKLIQFLDSNYQKTRDKSTFYVTQGIITPTTETIIGHLTGTLENWVKPADKAVTEWIKSKKAGVDGLNICIIDFADTDQFISTVISLNASNIF